VSAHGGNIAVAKAAKANYSSNFERILAKYLIPWYIKIFHNIPYANLICRRNIQMSPLCRVETALGPLFGGRIAEGGLRYADA
jgi:hypothetical protein